MLGWLFRNRVFLFLWATITGCLFALVWRQYEQTIHQTLTYYRITPSSFDYQWAYKSWLGSQGLRSVPVLRKNDTEAKNKKVVTEDQWLVSKIPVFCVVLSKKIKQTKAVKNTWAKHCNNALFYGSFNDASVPVNKINAKDNWLFLCEVLSKVWNGYHEDFKWVLVVTDRTFALVENLRYMVSSLDHNESFYLGHAFRDYSGAYNVEDAGYVLSWKALAVLDKKFPTPESCSSVESWHNGHRTLGKVLEEQGIKPRDTRDIMERSRFLPFNLDKLLIPGAISVFSRYWRESVFLSPEGSGCCSDFVITFSDVPPDKMYMMEYIIYHLKPVSRNWPLVEDVGPPPEVATTAPAAKVKPTGKAIVSDLSKKNSKGNGSDHKAGKTVKIREAVAKPEEKREGKVAEMGENEIEVNGKQKVSSNEKILLPATLDGDGKKMKSSSDNHTSNKEQAKNGHTNPGEKENGIEIRVYDDTFQDDEDGDTEDEGYGAKSNKKVENSAKKIVDEAIAKNNVDDLLQNTI